MKKLFVGVVILAQKLSPPVAAVDVPLALAIVGLGTLIVVAPDAAPGLTTPMRPATAPFTTDGRRRTMTVTAWNEPAGGTPRCTLVVLPGRGETAASY